jgi:hypothetical protein
LHPNQEQQQRQLMQSHEIHANISSKERAPKARIVLGRTNEQFVEPHLIHRKSSPQPQHRSKQ